MKHQGSTLLALIAAVLLAAGAAAAGQAKPGAAPAAAAGQAPAAPTRLVPPVRGEAKLGYTKPVRKDERGTIITTFQVKNMSPSPIAGLKVEEFWFDKAGNPLPGDTFRYKKPLQPAEVITVELRTPRDPKMSGNRYNFTHLNGTVKPTLVAKF